MICVRTASASDMAEVTAIYAWNVLNGTGTFAIEPPAEAEMTEKFREIVEMNLPYLVAEEDGEVIGFAYAAPFRTRPAYRYGVEDSVYLRPGCTGRGVGKALLNRLIEACTTRGLYMMYAVIGDRDNIASVGVHKACGFTETGTLPDAGYKFGRWLDVVFMARTLRLRDQPPLGNGWGPGAS